MNTENNKRVDEGTRFLATLWLEIATRIVELAIDTYTLTKEQATALRNAFLRRVQYTVVTN